MDTPPNPYAERARLIGEMRTLLDAAEAESRGMTDAERTEYRALETAIAAVDLELTERQGTLRAGIAGQDGATQRTIGDWLAGEFRALGEGSGSGSFFVPIEFLPRVWDRLAATSVGLASGFTVIDTIRDEQRFPKVTADVTAAFVAEGATIAPSDPTAQEVVATVRKLAGLTVLSNEVILDANPSILEAVTQNLLRSLALALDDGFYEGDGVAPNIRGLKNVSGIQEVVAGTNGAAPTNLDWFADAIGMLEEANARAGAIAMHPRTWKALLKLKEQASGHNKPLLQDSGGSGAQGVQRSIYGVPVFLSSQLSITETQGSSGAVCSSAYVYQPDQVVAVRRQEARVELDRSRLFNSDQAELRGISRWDMVVPHAAAVVRVKGIL